MSAEIIPTEPKSVDEILDYLADQLVVRFFQKLETRFYDGPLLNGAATRRTLFPKRKALAGSSTSSSKPRALSSGRRSKPAVSSSELDETDQMIIELARASGDDGISSGEVESATGQTRGAVVRRLKNLRKSKHLRMEGTKRHARYFPG